MKKIILSASIILFSASPLTASASESLLDDLERFWSATDQAPTMVSTQWYEPEVGSISSESILDDLEILSHIGGSSSVNYTTGEAGSESLLDDLERFGSFR